jgi:hypothetical protein
MRNALEPLLRVSKCRIWPISGPLVLCFQPPANGTATGAYQRGITELLGADVPMDALSFGDRAASLSSLREKRPSRTVAGTAVIASMEKRAAALLLKTSADLLRWAIVWPLLETTPASESDRFARNDGDRQSYLAIDEPPRLRAVDKLVRSFIRIIPSSTQRIPSGEASK